MRLTPRSIALLASLLLAACDSPAEEAEGDGETGGEMSYAADIQPIFDANCSCHTPTGIGDTLDLTAGYSAIVDVPSTQAPGVDFVEPGSAADSYLVAKLRDQQLDVGGTGTRMPLNATDPLDEATISTIEAWIDAGAPE
jgi:hypothetical protein